MTVTCPGCTHPLHGEARCSNCNLLLVGPTAAQLWKLDQEIGALNETRQQLLTRLHQESQLTTSIPAGVPADVGAGAGAPGSGQWPGAARQADARVPAQQQWQTQWEEKKRNLTGQQVLLGLGALLVVLAALVFAAVAWDRLGPLGQLGMVGAITGGLAAGAIKASRKGLAQTAEALGAAAGGLLVIALGAAHSLGLVQMDGATWTAYATVTTTVLAAAAWQTRREVRAFGILAAISVQTITPAILNATETPLQWWAPLLTAAGIAGAVAGWKEKGAVGHTAFALGAFVTTAATTIGILQSHDDTTSSAILGATAVLGTAAAVLVTSTRTSRESWKPALQAAGGILTGIAAHAAAITADPSTARNGIVIAAIVAAAAAVTGTLKQVDLPRAAQAGGLTLLGLSTLTVDGPQLAAVLVAATVAAGVVAVRSRRNDSVIAAAGGIVTGYCATAVSLDAAGTSTPDILLVLTVATAATSLWASTWRKAQRLPAETTAAVLGMFAVAGSVIDSTWYGPTTLWIAAGTFAVHATRKERPHTSVAATALLSAGAAAALIVAQPPVNHSVTILVALGAALLAATLWKPLTKDQPGHETVAAATLLLALIGATENAELLATTLWATAAITLLHALRARRGILGPVGVVLAAAGNSVILSDRGVDLVEAYTLPLAAGLLAIGLVHEWRARQAGKRAPSWLVTGPAAAAALVPSMLVALEEYDPTRALLVLLAAGTILVIGLLIRHQSLLLLPGAVTVLTGWHIAAPYAALLPRWTILLAVGAGLLLVGATYEARLADLKRAGRWVQALR